MAVPAHGGGAIRYKKLTADRLANAVREVVTNPTYAQRATDLATAIANEDGAAHVLTTVNNLT